MAKRKTYFGRKASFRVGTVRKVPRMSDLVMAPMTAPGYRRKRFANLRTGGQLGIDLKCVDQDCGATLLQTWAGGELDLLGGGVLMLGPCVQGNGLANRDGCKTVMKRIDLQGTIYRPHVAASGAAREASHVCIALVQDCQTNGAQLNAEDVYTTAGTDAFPRRVIENSSRYKVLWKFECDLQDSSAFNDAAATGAIGGTMQHFACHKKLEIPVNFVAGAGAGTIADIRDNSLHLIGCSYNSAVDTIAYVCRIRFVG